MIKNISNLGDAALYCDFGEDVNKEVNSNVIKYFKNIKEKNIKGVINLTPSYNKLIISFDLKKINFIEIKKIVENLDINDFKLICKRLACALGYSNSSVEEAFGTTQSNKEEDIKNLLKG